ncbi:SIMPL domain-containing protein [Candidatus Woesearchaeota archaeon]|nr:SIMPL domain-containing protein [Candidatus Woesearchaeota archaeon]
MKKILMIILVIALIALTGCVEKEGNTINVEGSSELTVEPDEAEVWTGISIVKLNAQEAQDEANIVINAVIDELQAAGFDDIETEQLSLYEERRWEEGESKVVGWRATQTLKIKTTELDKVGQIVDISVKNGANQINNINFGLSETEEQEYKKQALSDATKNAKSKAETIADSLEVKLGDIKSVSESDFYFRPYMYAMEKAVGVDAVAEAAAIMPGKVTVTARVSIVYNIR